MFGMEKDLSIWTIGTGIMSELRMKSSTYHVIIRVILIKIINVAFLLPLEEIQNTAMVSQ
jgi:hypothetical protein